MSRTTRIATVVVLALAAATALAQNNAQTETQKVFTSIKNMPGSWEGTPNNGESLVVTF